MKGLVRKPKGKKPFKITRHEWKHKGKMDLTEKRLSGHGQDSSGSK
jgi:hypothetical protein